MLTVGFEGVALTFVYMTFVLTVCEEATEIKDIDRSITKRICPYNAHRRALKTL